MHARAGEAAVDVVCLGEALIDFFPSDPTPGPLSRVARFDRQLGGAPCNVAVGLARLGVCSALLTRVGHDAFGDFIVEALAAEGVQVATVGRSPRRTGLAFVALAADGERDFLFYRGPGANADLDPAWVDEHRAVLQGARALHLCSDSLCEEPEAAATRRAVAIARAAGIPISVDLNLRFHLWSDREQALSSARWLASQATLLKVDATEAEALCGAREAEAAEALATFGPQIVAVTCGADGAYWRCPDGSGHVGAPAVAVVDSTGAGDAFSAAMLATLIRAGDRSHDLVRSATVVARAVERGCENGAAACTALGATAALLRS